MKLSEYNLHACDMIAASGKLPTIEALQELAAQSNPDIAPALTVWEAFNSELQKVQFDANNSKNLDLSRKVWWVARHILHAALEQVRAELDDHVKDMTLREEEFTASYHNLKKNAQKIIDQNDSIQRRFSAIANAQKNAMAGFESIREDLRALQARACNIERYLEEIKKELDISNNSIEWLLGDMGCLCLGKERYP